MRAAGRWLSVLENRRPDLDGRPDPKGVYIRSNLFVAY